MQESIFFPSIPRHMHFGVPLTQDFPLSTEALRYWLALLRAPLVGTRSFAAILEQFTTPEQLFRAGRREWVEAGLKTKTVEYLANPDWQRIEQDLVWLQDSGRHCLALGDPHYPSLLREISDPPPLLFVVGNPECLTGRHIAMVGSRNPSPGGLRTARELAESLARCGFGIVSGLALGIDAASHQGALAAEGITVAVGGTGPDQVYPRSHRRLAEEIVARNGALITEFPPGTLPVPGNFPRRNRIISGLSLGTLVVEAAPRSGSLITARMAVEQGREVFAVPGSIYSPLSRGCHDLIKDGAKLIQEAADVLAEFEFCGNLPAPMSPNSGVSDEGAVPHRLLLEQMGHDPASIDALVSLTGETANKITSMLVLLELEGYVASTAGGGYYRLR